MARKVATPRARVPAVARPKRRRPTCSHTSYDTASEASDAAVRAQVFRENGRAMWKRCSECDKYVVYFA